MVKISVVICTLNRAVLLDEALQCIQTLSYPLEDCETIVVDNGSEDNTKEIVLRWQGKLNNLRYVMEAQKGLSVARNRGFEEARYDWVAYLDDDARPDSQWLTELANGISNFRCDAYGGPIETRFVVTPPDWILTQRLKGYYGDLDLGNQSIALKYPNCPNGSNMIFKKEILKQIGGFSSSLGRKGDSLLSAEESDVFLKIDELNYKVLYLPNAKVAHLVFPERMTKAFLRCRAFAQGQSDFIVFRNQKNFFRSSIKRFIIESKKILLHPIFSQFQNWVEWQTSVWYLLGFFSKLFQ